MGAAEPAGDGGTAAAVPVTVLRLDRPELAGTHLVVRAVDLALRERRRTDRTTPLGYLYDRTDHDELDRDLTLDAGHYDEDNQVWSFSAEVPGIIGLTEPLTSAGTPSAGNEGDDA